MGKDEFIEKLNENKCDIAHLEGQMKGDILSQSLYAKIVVDKTKDLLGQEEMDKADDDFKEFNKTLISTVEKLLKNPNSSSSNKMNKFY